MGNLKPIDSALVKDVDYDLISPDTVGGEYIETIGAACENPDGYTSGSLFLGKLNGVQHLYRATAAIAFGEDIILDTNCTYTTISGELGSAYEEIDSLNEALTNQVLYFTSVACSATTGNFATKSDASITADHVVAECTFANPSAITTDVTWTTASGSVTLNGTCASATTANLVLVKKGN